MNALDKSAFDKLNIKLAHVGLNFETDAEASAAADLLCRMLGKNKIEIPGLSYFVGDSAELMAGGAGSNGHIGFYTDDLEATADLMDSIGYNVDRNTLRTDPNGRPFIFYLSDEYFGFAIHFTQRPLQP